MEHFIKNIEISNFKSFKHLQVEGFKRINLFIGKPNVGKSNFLEALGLFGLPFLTENNFDSKITDLIRLETLSDFFYDGNLGNEIRISLSDEGKLKNGLEVSFEKAFGSLKIESMTFDGYDHFIDNNLNFLAETPGQKIDNIEEGIRRGYFYAKPYFFKKILITNSHKFSFLNPPFGDNISYMLQLHSELRKKVSVFFKEYGLKLVVDIGNNKIAIQKEKEDNTVFQIPFNSIADTLQRIIFYKTAIASNENSVLIFEEPEAHAFPPYIAEFTRDVINSTTNQFFIATHSPFILNDFLEDAREELAIYIVDFKDGQTVMKGLSREEIEEVYKYGVDLFFNYESYLA